MKRKYQNQIKQVDKQSLKMEMTEILAAKFNLSKIDVLLSYESFYRSYPDGVISRESYMEENRVREACEFQAIS